jgi:hypothetical protein
MAKSASPMQASGKASQVQAGGGRDGQAAPPPPPIPVDPTNNPPSRGGDPVS